ncbi:alpha/beta fold hydrolase [Dactylosporangium matsuzakiense]|uniref:AB hydrolase-1 domain-containing protein n=1 Tax=Dactylosporangium matsuzakiense TaxID=53360 RepID=A0A9W6KIB9_9ACTN|nr:alpha/beta hydrolase [Dactylosporangium matsuzakiense]UWZ41079.1 alpha/beta hydrolase [Dactylosporangium matsuzakiense]GLL01024.1 hypothetical protein GCM10017581_027650 [Dactylosporangium matsuzakiense]
MRTRIVDVDDAELFVTVDGSGPPILLLRQDPELARRLAFWATVVGLDLRGHGQSAARAGAEMSARAMARDALDVMGDLGCERFTVVGHGLGAAVALCLATEYPAAVIRLALVEAAWPAPAPAMPMLVTPETRPAELSRAVLELMGLTGFTDNG